MGVQSERSPHTALAQTRAWESEGSDSSASRNWEESMSPSQGLHVETCLTFKFLLVPTSSLFTDHSMQLIILCLTHSKVSKIWGDKESPARSFPPETVASKEDDTETAQTLPKSRRYSVRAWGTHPGCHRGHTAWFPGQKAAGLSPYSLVVKLFQMERS